MNQIAIFKNRWEAGERLAARLARSHKTGLRTIVLGVGMGGIPVAAAVAELLQLPLDIVLVETMRSPAGETVGAATPTTIFIDTRFLTSGEMTRRQLDVLRTRAQRNLLQRANRYRAVRRDVDLTDVRVLLVADAMVTGASMRAAAEAVRRAGAQHIVAAAPLATAVTQRRLQGVVDELVSIGAPLDTHRIEGFYSDFTPPTDEDVMGFLAAAATRPWFSARALPRDTPASLPAALGTVRRG